MRRLEHFFTESRNLFFFVLVFDPPKFSTSENKNALLRASNINNALISTIQAQTDCPDVPPVTCDDLTEQNCYGGVDPDFCPLPEFCWPVKGSPGKDGNPCPNPCPAKCNPDQQVCPEGKDANDCPHPDYCMQISGTGAAPRSHGCRGCPGTHWLLKIVV